MLAMLSQASIPSPNAGDAGLGEDIVIRLPIPPMDLVELIEVINIAVSSAWALIKSKKQG